jgi:hypothetical protein
MSSQAESPGSPNSANEAGGWPEPPWSGWIETTGDALLILEAARRGLIPRVTRRLVDSERKMITSGSVFVFDEDESGIKRWTDGFVWSPSRILGNFLVRYGPESPSPSSLRPCSYTEKQIREAPIVVKPTRTQPRTQTHPKRAGPICLKHLRRA